MSNYTTAIGIVKNNADPAEHGRLQIYIPSIDSKFFNIESLPWATYVSPFGGSTANFKVGREQKLISGITSYGMWAIPKIGAQVTCGFLDGDPHIRFWTGCIYLPQFNRTLPQSIDGGLTEIDESQHYAQSVIGHQQENLTKAGLQPGTIHYKTRGGYERSVSAPVNRGKKPTDNGYAKNPLDPNHSDSQTFSVTTPGRHYFVMSDVDEYCRIRLKTTEGSQIIFDDTNERIYISTAQGKNWVELDEGNGKIYFYSDSKVSVRSKNDINFYSDENINIVAKKRINLKSETRSINLESDYDIRMLSNKADIMMTASRDIQLKTINGPTASAIGEMSVCSTGTSGYVYNWSEKAGSSTSSIKFDAAQGIEGKASKTINLTSNEALNIKSVSGNLNFQAGSIMNIKATSAINYSAPDIGLIVIDGIEGPIPVFAKDNADSADSAKDSVKLESEVITDHMIKPDHEPWVRDEDESKCKTPRNKSYKG